MSLHNRIIGQLPDDIIRESEAFYEGFAEAGRKASRIVTEAADLMAEMAELIDGYKMIMQEMGVKPNRTDVLLAKYNAWKEKNK